jgi:hypothetical protein
MGIRLTCINTRNFINKNIKIIFFYFLKNIFNVNLSKQYKIIKKNINFK